VSEPLSAPRNDSAAHALLVAVAVALVCSGMVAAAVYWLRPLQQVYAQLERDRAIVAAAGFSVPGNSDRDVLNRYLSLDARVLDLTHGTLNPALDGRTYDHWQTPPAEGAPTYVPIYLVQDDGHFSALILPIDGPGMWSTVYGYVTLAADLTTIERLTIYRHGETPGIGDRIEDPTWLASWHDKRIYDADGNVAIEVVKQANPQSPFQVDAISGATVSSTRLGSIVANWMATSRYGAWLTSLRERGGMAALESP
jgi:Na+-transporting NADH:ubiquinone oxidoreductase subunit C